MVRPSFFYLSSILFFLTLVRGAGDGQLSVGSASQPGPSRSENACGGCAKLLLHLVHRTERLVDRLRQLRATEANRERLMVFKTQQQQSAALSVLNKKRYSKAAAFFYMLPKTQRKPKTKTKHDHTVPPSAFIMRMNGQLMLYSRVCFRLYYTCTSIMVLYISHSPLCVATAKLNVHIRSPVASTSSATPASIKNQRHQYIICSCTPDGAERSAFNVSSRDGWICFWKKN